MTAASDGSLRVAAEYSGASDPTAHVLCHLTNLAFREGTLFTANLGRWHITAIEGLF